jgi:hypothetical protein
VKQAERGSVREPHDAGKRHHVTERIVHRYAVAERRQLAPNTAVVLARVSANFSSSVTATFTARSFLILVLGGESVHFSS